MKTGSSPQAPQSQNALIAGIRKRLNEVWDAVRNTPQAFRLVWAASRPAALVGVGLTLVAAFLPAGQAWAGKLIIDTIINSTKQGLTAEQGLRQVLPFLGLELALVLISSLTSSARSLSDRVLQSQLSNHINSLVMRKAIALDLAFFENPLFYDTLQNARRQADSSALNIVKSSLQLVQQLITLISLIVLLVRFSPWLALIVFVSAIPSFLAQSQYAERAFRAVSRRAPESRLLNYLETLLTGNETVKEVKLFGLGETLLARYQELFIKFYLEDRAIAERRTLASLGWGLLSDLAYYGSYAWIVWRTILGVITLGDMSMFLSIFRQSQHSIRSLLDNVSRLYESNLFLDNLMTYLELVPVLTSPENGLPAPAPIRQGIEFRNVSFSYPGASKLVLRNINLHIRPGERMALVGLNGAGKTTLIKLLARLYDPTEGQILIDGIDLRDMDLASLHQRFGVIFQDYVRYQFSVRENIGFGQVEALEDFERIQDAAERGGATTVIEGLPQGYDTVLGRRWEKGAELSGGQWQKIALARAFMRKAEVMVLDEPTSALDAQAEYEVFQRFGELMEGRIAVLISHRFSTVRMADRIVVLGDGEIRELGTHAELMANDDAYARLFNLQAEGYR
ncbi:MAG: ABC transporter ATP-binding protein [Anaerolineae bacterium]|jgi:ATP-binding cassette subfamily B protein|nr:ABC transporter ATP-binding protein [Anaerolineae bacterium]